MSKMRHISRVGIPSIKYPFVESKLAQQASYATTVDCQVPERPRTFPKLPPTFNDESYDSRKTHNELAEEVLKRIRLRYKPPQENAPQRQLTKSEVHLSTNESKPIIQKYKGMAEILETDKRKPSRKRDLNTYAARASNVSLSKTFNPQRGNRATYHTDRTPKSDMTRSRYKYVNGYVENTEKLKNTTPNSITSDIPKVPYITRLSQLLGKGLKSSNPKEDTSKSQSVHPSYCETSTNKSLPNTYVEQIPTDSGVVKTYKKRKFDELGKSKNKNIRARLFPASVKLRPAKSPTKESLPFEYIPKEPKEPSKFDGVSSSPFYEATSDPVPKRASPEDLQAAALRQLQNVQQKNSVLRMQRNEHSKRVQQRINIMLQDTKIKLMNKKKEAERYKKGVKELEPQIYAKSSLGVRPSHLPLEPCRGEACQPKAQNRRPFSQ